MKTITPKKATRGPKLSDQLGKLDLMRYRTGAHELAVAINMARVILAWMTDEEFETISERATKGWLE